MNRRITFTRLCKREQAAVPLNKIQKTALDDFRYNLIKGVYQFEEVPCLCGNQDSILIGETDRYALPVDTHLCKICGMMWTSPRLTEESLAQFYNDNYRSIYLGEPKASDDFFNDQIQHGKSIYNFVTKIIKSDLNLKVFDIGCGAGGILIPFKEAGWSTFGCDMGREYLKRGQDAGLTLEYGEAANLKRYAGANLVILSHVLEHFNYPLKQLKSISDLLVDQGYIYIELPGVFAIHRTYGDILLFLQNAHLYHFTLATLTTLMNEAGFKLVKGDEYIHALFQKDNQVKQEKINHNHFRKVLLYLYWAEIERIIPFSRSMDKIKSSIIKMIKIILGEKMIDRLKQKLRR